jgi:hypothetical protein
MQAIRIDTAPRIKEPWSTDTAEGSKAIVSIRNDTTAVCVNARR